MSDSQQPGKRRNLSEISHLFLSSVRDRQTEGAPRPQRLSPRQRADISIDLTPEEFARMHAGREAGSPGAGEMRLAPVWAVIGSHLNGRQLEHVKAFARHLAAGGKRVGLIELDAAQCRLMCFDSRRPDGDGAGSSEEDERALGPRQFEDALHEMSCDVDQWLLSLPKTRTPEARALLPLADRWTILSTCDHDGIVACYRTLKGLADLRHPRLAIALLEARDDQEVQRVSRKLSGVCGQFLGWEVQDSDAVKPAPAVAEHAVLVYRPIRDDAHPADAPHWQIITRLLDGEHAPAPVAPEPPARRAPQPIIEATPERIVADVVVPVPPAAVAQPSAPLRLVPPAPLAAGAAHPTAPSADTVIDLPDTSTDNATLLAAVLGHCGADLVQSPVRPPMCPEARVAVGADRRLTLLAVTRQGLGDLRRIAQAYRWLLENRPLVALAMPQMEVDASGHPELRLFVDHADHSDELLRPMLQWGNVRVRAYRMLHWHGKTGLLLEAA